ncbi:Rho GTPase-activating protein 20 [Liparis tanakae]|uniref:Rho GTPase-activating protein 20 n=1 Tax=Liparis tanakae TaxID=230148 RepID=A0A4Z2F355_9TELE|nr:Rho GTPase-activating protein 20 [Liparis tanakae]
MDSMAPRNGTVGQNRSGSLTGDGKKKMKTLARRRQSAPSLVISKALTRSRSTSRDRCRPPGGPESCVLVQAILAESPRRLLLGHAPTQLRTGLQSQERHLFLFTDMLLVAKARLDRALDLAGDPGLDPAWPHAPCRSPSLFKLKARVRLSDVWTAGCLDQGSVEDHRLWVTSRKDEPPYPLIGHECPFSIKMSHLRDGRSSGGGGLGGGLGGVPASPWGGPGGLGQGLPPDTLCQFILQPSMVAPGPAPPTDSSSSSLENDLTAFSEPRDAHLLLRLLPAGQPEPGRPRRRSEPAAAPSSAPGRGRPARKASYDAAVEGGEGEECLERGMSALQLKEVKEDGGQKGGARVQSGGRRKLKLDDSRSSPSSPATSPTGSSLSSLDSAFSQYSTGSAPLLPLFPSRPQVSPEREAPPLWPPPHGLHRKERRLSPRRCDDAHSEEAAEAAAHSEEDDPTGPGAAQHAARHATGSTPDRRRPGRPPSYQQALLQSSRGHEEPLTLRPPTPASQTGSEATRRLARSDGVPPPRGVFFAATLVLEGPRSSGGLRGSRPLPAAPRFSPSPSAPVRDYFSSQEERGRSQEEERERRRSEPRADHSDQLLPAEESYV